MFLLVEVPYADASVFYARRIVWVEHAPSLKWFSRSFPHECSKETQIGYTFGLDHDVNQRPLLAAQLVPGTQHPSLSTRPPLCQPHPRPDRSAVAQTRFAPTERTDRHRQSVSLTSIQRVLLTHSRTETISWHKHTSMHPRWLAR